MRQAVFHDAARALCSSIKHQRPPPPQLGQSRERLQVTAKKVYGDITESYINTLGDEDGKIVLQFGMSPKETEKTLLATIKDMTDFRYDNFS